MLATDNEQWAERARVMSLHGISSDAWKRYTTGGSWYYEVIAPGYKYNMTDIAAAMGLVQLRRLEEMLARRVEVARRYSATFDQLAQLEVPRVAPDRTSSWHLYLLRLNLDTLRCDRAEFIRLLETRGISTSVHFIPLHLHPYYRDTYGYRADDLPVAQREYLRTISLPIYSRMTDEDVDDVVEAVTRVARDQRR
jgi:dTDP-4-amino-4,6-dideoxygalactose transaminase